MIPPSTEWRLPTQHIGRRVLVYDQLDSTNNLAASLAEDPLNDGLVVLAREQKAGRGQHGRHWECPPNMGVLLSVLVFPPSVQRRPAVLTAWAAVSVCEVILKLTGLEAQIKWPNDVHVRGKKVCGILIEQARGTVAGIGLNVNQPAEAFAKAGLPLAGSLRVFTEKSMECDLVARRLIAQLDEEYARLREGDLSTLEARWKCRMGLIGQTVLVECVEKNFRGRLLDMTFDCLELDICEGETLPMTLRPEMVKQVSVAP